MPTPGIFLPLALLPTIGVQELLLLFLIILIIFGASKLPLLGRGLGEGIRNFKKGLKDEPSEIEGSQEEGSAKGTS